MGFVQIFGSKIQTQGSIETLKNAGTKLFFMDALQADSVQILKVEQIE